METYTTREFVGYKNRKGPNNQRIFTNFSASFRQWAAEGTHCKYLHSYVITFRVVFNDDVREIFKRDVQERKQIQQWFKLNFDKVTFVAEDDPQIKVFERLKKDEIIKLKVLPKIGCEMFAKYTLEELNKFLQKIGVKQHVVEVEVFEHDKNSAIFKLNQND
jgi:6-pyruvoyltetrahydropterin/6-carboxytetrahydropterin synthase